MAHKNSWEGIKWPTGTEDIIQGEPMEIVPADVGVPDQGKKFVFLVKVTPPHGKQEVAWLQEASEPVVLQGGKAALSAPLGGKDLDLGDHGLQVEVFEVPDSEGVRRLNKLLHSANAADAQTLQAILGNPMAGDLKSFTVISPSATLAGAAGSAGGAASGSGGGPRITPFGALAVELERHLDFRIEDLVNHAIVARQEDLFKLITDELDSLKRDDLSPSVQRRIAATHKNETLTFTGMKAYELLDRCMNQAMMKYLAFDSDRAHILAMVRKAVADINTQWDWHNRPALIGQIRTIVQDTTRTYFSQIADQIVPAYLARINRLHTIIDESITNIDDVLTTIYVNKGADGGFPDGDEWAAFNVERLKSPVMCELIWSYYHEEGMLVQTMKAITLRFQNKLLGAGRDPLANLNTSPLRPLSGLVWGYIQKEPERLSVRRRNYEYDHHYGISLHGKAVLDFSPADSRRAFIRAFHRLLNLCTAFYKQLDDTTIVADAFPIKNALRDVHLILAEGAHNQFGDLPWEARKEMLIEQYMLSLPEMREFLGGRSMIPYREKWMENVDTMKRLQSWTDVSVEQFNTLARVGEQIVLTVRFGDWNDPNVQVGRAFAWATWLRPWVQEYIHAYESITGVDLRDARQVDDTMPSVHLRRRLEEQTRRAA